MVLKFIQVLLIYYIF